jgi:hypothetical protein
MRTRLMQDADCNWKGCRGRFTVTTGSPSSFSGLPLLWSQPHALFVPGQLLDDEETHFVGGVRAVAFVGDGRRSVNHLFSCFC